MANGEPMDDVHLAVSHILNNGTNVEPDCFWFSTATPSLVLTRVVAHGRWQPERYLALDIVGFSDFGFLKLAIRQYFSCDFGYVLLT